MHALALRFRRALSAEALSITPGGYPAPSTGDVAMHSFRYAPVCALLLVALVGGGHRAAAQAPTGPWVEMESLSVNVGLGGQAGDGVLRLPNLGSNCAYAFKVEGFGAGIHVGLSK